MGGFKFKIHFFLIKWIAATLYDWMCIYIRRLKVQLERGVLFKLLAGLV